MSVGPVAWTWQEDAVLLDAIHGKSAAENHTKSGLVRWSHIRKSVLPHRSTQQMRCRYQRIDVVTEKKTSGEESGDRGETSSSSSLLSEVLSVRSPVSSSGNDTRATSTPSPGLVGGLRKAKRRNKCRACGRDRKGHICRAYADDQVVEREDVH